MYTSRRSANRAAIAIIAAVALANSVVVSAESGPSVTSPDDASAADLAAIAESRGWTIEEAEASEHATDVIRQVGRKVREARPTKFVITQVALEPFGSPRLFIKGPADAVILGIAAAADIHVEVVDGQPYSYGEQLERVGRVHRALLDLGIDDFRVGSNLTGRGVIPITIRETPQAPSMAAVLDAVPASLREDVRVSFSDSGRRSPDNATGGMKLTSSYDPEHPLCTSGFTVIDATSTLGVVSAAHCPDTLNRISSADHPMTLQDEHYGEWGDVEFYTTSTDELPYFYADTDDYREVRNVEANEDIALNENICAFGRGGLEKHCSTVADPVDSCGSLQHLVRMQDDNMSEGDSGGPWYKENRAYGIHHGPCGAGDMFSKADRLDEALGVSVFIDW